MEGWKIFAHSVQLVARNWKEALQIFLVPSLIAGVITYLAATAGGSTLTTTSDGNVSSYEFMSGTTGLAVLLGYLAILTIVFWCIVSWHRFVLLSEYPKGWIPPFRFDRILSYLGHGVLLALVAAAAMIPFALLLGGLAQASNEALALVLIAPIYLAIVVLVYRLSPVLPAAAIGVPLKLREAFEATKGASGSIVVLLVVSFGANVLLQALALGIGFVIPALGALLSFVVTVFLSMVNISVLTTFYGHFIEGRAID